MAELGALSLRIETVGDKQALSSLDAIDRKAQQTAGSNVKLTAAQKALNREIAESAQIFALQARTADLSDKQQVAGLRQVATAQLQYMQRVGASEKQLLQFAATAQAFEQRVAGATTNAAAGVQVFGREITNAHGKVSAFGKSGLNAFNALAFGISQMAATGTVSFRSLATSMTSVLAFFGPQGAIAAGVIATGLVMFDFLSRTKKGAQEAADELNRMVEAGNKRFAEREPVLTAKSAVDRRQAEVDRLNAEIAKKNEQIAKPGAGLAVAGLIGDRTELEKELARATFGLTEAQNALADAQKAVGKTATEAGNAEVDALAKVLAAGTATNANRDRANQLLTTARASLAELTRANQADAQVVIRRAALMDRIKTLTDALTGAQKKNTDTLDAMVRALLAASKANLTTLTDLPRIVAAEQALNDQLGKTTTTYADRVRILQDLKALEEARLKLTQQQALVEKDLGKPAVGVTPGVGAVPPTGITVPKVSFADQMVAEAAAEAARFQEQLAQTLAAVITAGIIDGFERGIESGSFAEGFKAMAGAFSAGLGGLLIQIGQQVITSSVLIKNAVAAIASMNPFAALAAGIALVALGSALRGKGGGRGGAGVSTGGYGGGSGTGGLDTIRSFVTGSDRLSALTAAPKGLRDSIGDLRRSTFGSDAIGALSPRTSLGSLTTASAPANPLSGLRFVVMNEPSGQREVAFVVNTYNRDRGGR